MAKVLAPLFAFSASGKLADALVYFSWKGLNVVRSYKIPANPKSTAQTTQRGYVHAGVDAVHAAQALAVSPLVAIDAAAYALLGSTFPTPRTWFNQVIKEWVDQYVAVLHGAIYHGAVMTPGVDQITFLLKYTKEGANDITAGFIWYGTSKTAMINSLAATGAEITAGKVIPSLVTGVKYFMQYRPTAHIDYAGANSGIYYAVAG
jgi:hypothetical protein